MTAVLAREGARRPRLWVVGGGKGGTGKSVVSSGLACALARKGREAVLVDADFGGANLHLFFALNRPPQTLEDFLGGKTDDLSALLRPSPQEHLRAILGSGSEPGTADLGPEDGERLVQALSTLEADDVVCDLGAGSTAIQLAIFNRADRPVLVINPEPTSVENAYAFLKVALLAEARRSLGPEHPALETLEQIGERPLQELASSIDGVYAGSGERLAGVLERPAVGVVVNRVAKEASVRLAWGFASVAREHLGAAVGYGGFVEEDERVARQLASRQFVYAANGAAVAAGCLGQVVRRSAEEGFRVVKERPGGASGEQTKLPLFNDEVRVDGRVLHIQTEDLGARDRAVLSLVYSRGRIVFRKRLGYEELAAQALGRAGTRSRVEWLHNAVLSGVRRGRVGQRAKEVG